MEHQNQKGNLERVLNGIKKVIETAHLLRNRELIKICKENQYNFVGEKQNHRIFDLLETSVNLHLFEEFRSGNKENAIEILTKLEDLEQRLPTQSWRDAEQSELQQFSTPPALAFVMSEFLKIRADSVTLEPSAGTGCLALWLKLKGCRVEVNEISYRRRELLELQGYKPHNVNAEFIKDLLEPEIKPDFILMNPPFSTSGGRVNARNSEFGFRHVESAIQLLNPGGRLVCLLGADSCLKTNKGKLFWNRIGREFVVPAFLKVPMKAFYKHGTTFQTCVVIVQKPVKEKIPDRKKADKPQIIEFRSLKEMLQFSQTFD